MRTLTALVLLSLSLPAISEGPTIEEQLAEAEKAAQKELTKYKEEHKGWDDFPNNGEYLTYYEKWVGERFTKKDKVLRDACEADKKKCDNKRINYLQQEKISLVSNMKEVFEKSKTEKKNPQEWNKSLDNKNRVMYFSMCQNPSISVCDDLSSRDKKFIELDRANNKKLDPLMEEMGKTKEGTPEYLALQHKLSDAQLEHYKTSFETFCKEDADDWLLCKPTYKEFEEENRGLYCFHERVQLAHDTLKPEAVSSALPNRVEHLKKWAKMKNPKDCKAFLKEDAALLALSPDKKETTPPLVVVAEEVNAAAVQPVVVQPTELSEDKDNRGYKPETCEWVKDIPRKVVMGPGGAACKLNDQGKPINAHICTGYVVCEQKDGGGKFIRMATCSPGNCADGKAVACVKQKKYSSVKAKDEEHETISGKVREAVLEGLKKK